MSLLFSACSSSLESLEIKTPELIINTNWISDGDFVHYTKQGEVIQTYAIEQHCKSTFSFGERTGNMRALNMGSTFFTNCDLPLLDFNYSVLQNRLVINTQPTLNTINFEIETLTSTQLILIKPLTQEGDYIRMTYKASFLTSKK